MALFFVVKIGILKKIQKERRHNLMTNSVGYGSEVPAPPTRKPKTNAEEKRKFYQIKQSTTSIGYDIT